MKQSIISQTPAETREYLLAQERELRSRMTVEFIDPKDFVEKTVALERAYVGVLEKLHKINVPAPGQDPNPTERKSAPALVQDAPPAIAQDTRPAVARDRIVTPQSHKETAR